MGPRTRFLSRKTTAVSNLEIDHRTPPLMGIPGCTGRLQQAALSQLPQPLWAASNHTIINCELIYFKAISRTILQGW